MDRASGDGAGRRRMEEALQEGEERYGRLVEAAKDYAIFMTDADGRLITWNEGAERLFGYEEGDILGEDGSVLVVPEDREGGAPEREREEVRTEGRAEDERWHLRKDGTHFWASGFVRPVLDEEGDLIGFSKVARDLTEHRRAEEAVDEARRTERDRLARDLHDLVLQDLVYAYQACDAHRFLARDETRMGDLPNLGAVIDSLRRASQGVRQAIHELREGETVGRALARAVEGLVEMERRRSPGIRVELVVSEGVPEELPTEVCKDVMLVVREALANARRHSGARRVRVALGATEEEIRVEVSDDGAGFDPRQTPEGVGMRAIRDRTALLNGGLEVLSDPAGGTTVRLRMPRPS